MIDDDDDVKVGDKFKLIFHPNVCYKESTIYEGYILDIDKDSETVTLKFNNNNKLWPPDSDRIISYNYIKFCIQKSPHKDTSVVFLKHKDMKILDDPEYKDMFI